MKLIKYFKSKKGRDLLSTIAGCIVAMTTSWLLIDWNNFDFTGKNIFVLVLSAVNGLAGYVTTLKGDESK